MANTLVQMFVREVSGRRVQGRRCVEGGNSLICMLVVLGWVSKLRLLLVFDLYLKVRLDLREMAIKYTKLG